MSCAMRTQDPRSVLFADDATIPSELDRIGAVRAEASYGFYWTEGSRGLGWAEDAVPTVKGGSRVGTPSPPAVWVPRDDFVGTPELEDVERLQVFVRAGPSLRTSWTRGCVVSMDARGERLSACPWPSG